MKTILTIALKIPKNTADITRIARIFTKKNEKNMQQQPDENLKLRWCQSTQFEWLEKIAAVCKELNFDFYLILPPYNKKLLSALTHKFNTVVTQQLEQVYHKKLLDFTYDTSFKTDDFFDQSHLDIFGAEKLTKKIKFLIQKEQ